jgi:hypothetical protein
LPERAGAQLTNLDGAFFLCSAVHDEAVSRVMLAYGYPRFWMLWILQSRYLAAFNCPAGDSLPAFQDGTDHRPAEQDRAFLCLRHSFALAAISRQ